MRLHRSSHAFWCLFNSTMTHLLLLFNLLIMGKHLINITIRVCLVAQPCSTLCGAMDRSPPGSYVHGNSPGKNTGVGSLSLLQEIFPTQESNPGPPHCRQIFADCNAAAAAAAAAKLFQSCPPLCNPIDGSPPSSPIPGILQARTLEWVAISFSSA